MKIIFTIALMISLAIPVLAQKDNSHPNNDLRDEAFNSAKKLMSSLFSEKQHLKIYEDPPYWYKMNPRFGFIPIPPATKADRQAEMIPLYREGERIIKFIKK
jgi:hypothetical protein